MNVYVKNILKNYYTPIRISICLKINIQIIFNPVLRKLINEFGGESEYERIFI